MRIEMLARMQNENMPISELEFESINAYKHFYNRYAKRALDVVSATLLFIFLSPVLFIISIAIIIEDGFPVLYKAERGGYHGKIFKICKFRSMVKNADIIGGGTTALNDNRITKTGKIIRKLKVDELPNLLNVITGEMSFIGPRPELLQYTSQYQGAERFILEVRPGITDYSSIEFINLDEIVGQGNADEMYEQFVLPIKNKLRIKYAATVSFSTDIKLFCLTIWKVAEKAFGFILKREHQ